MTKSRYTIVKPDGIRSHAWITTEAQARHFALMGQNASTGDRLCGPRGETLGTVSFANVNDETGTTVDVRKTLA